MLKILKFGGSSIGDVQKIKNVIQIIKNSKADSLAVVLSAIGKTTNQLIEMAELAKNGDQSYKEIFDQLKDSHLKIAKEVTLKSNKIDQSLDEIFNRLANILQGIYLIQECSLRSMDLVMSFGERLSTLIVSQAMKCNQLDTRDIIRTDDNYGQAMVDLKKSYELIQKKFKSLSGITIVTGFIASTEEGITTTLGRSGSDYTASIIGAALNATEIEIWSDANGMMTADPRKVKNAFSIEHMSYQEAMEMCHFGASIIHPPTMQPAMKKRIPLRIRNTFNPDFSGTLIDEKSKKNHHKIRGISSIDKITLMRFEGTGLIGIRGVSMRLFGALASENINIILITQASSEHSICFAINPKDAKKAKKAIDKEFELEIKFGQVDELIAEKDLSILAVVGKNMQQVPGIAGDIFSALGKEKINIIAIAQGSSELNISLVIKKTDEKKALNLIHDSFFHA